MDALSAKILVELYQTNHEIIQQQLADISQEESLRQLPFRGNCMNWVVGHILGARGEALELMGLPGTLTTEENKMYGYGSEPITEACKAEELNGLVSRLEDALGRVIEGLKALTPEEMEREVTIWRGAMPVIEAIAFAQWHEAYHTGQLELLRQLAGKNDKVI